MRRKRLIAKRKTSKKKQEKPRYLLSASQTRRDPETNVYIPTEAEVDELKAWGEFCKL